MARAKNVLGTFLEDCNTDPMTGFFRDGCCNTGPEDVGLHTLCAEMTDEFLAFSKAQGNDLSTPNPMFQFPGLKTGDRWCLCVLRWKEAYEAGRAPGARPEESIVEAKNGCDDDGEGNWLQSRFRF